MRFRVARFALLSTVVFGVFTYSASAQSASLGVQKLADGVWAAQPAKGSNVGWFLYGDGVAAVDAGSDSATAAQILASINETTGGKPVRYVLLTHAHADHSGGVRAFVAAGAQVICHENAAPTVLSFITQASNDPADPLVKKRTSPTLMTIADRVILFDGKRRADVQWLGPAHTKGDLVILLPQEKVLFAGDLASNGRIPDLHLPDADAGAWAKALGRLASVSVDKMVPGHGTIGPVTGISDTAAYLKGLDDIVQRLARSGTPEEYIDARLRQAENKIPNVPMSQAHLQNAVALYRRLKEKLSAPAVTPTPRRANPPARTARPATAS